MKKSVKIAIGALVILITLSPDFSNAADKKGGNKAPDKKNETAPVACTDTDGSNPGIKGKATTTIQWRYAGERAWRGKNTAALTDVCKDSKNVTEYSCKGKTWVKQTLPCGHGCRSGRCLPRPGPRDSLRPDPEISGLDVLGLIRDGRNRRSGLISMPGWKPEMVIGALAGHMERMGKRINLLVTTDDSVAPQISGSSSMPTMTQQPGSVVSRNPASFSMGGYNAARNEAEMGMFRIAKGPYKVERETVYRDPDGSTFVILEGSTPGGTQIISTGSSNTGTQNSANTTTYTQGETATYYGQKHGCNSGNCTQTVDSEGNVNEEGDWVDATCDGMSCPEGQAVEKYGGNCRCTDTEESENECNAGDCADDEECSGGSCKKKSRDKCEGITCPEGKTCHNGTCSEDTADDSGDSSESQCPPEIDGCQSGGGGIDTSDPQIRKLLAMLSNCQTPGMAAVVLCGQEGCGFSCNSLPAGVMAFLRNPGMVRIQCQENNPDCNQQGKAAEGAAPTRGRGSGWTDPHPAGE